MYKRTNSQTCISTLILCSASPASYCTIAVWWHVMQRDWSELWAPVVYIVVTAHYCAMCCFIWGHMHDLWYGVYCLLCIQASSPLSSGVHGHHAEGLADLSRGQLALHLGNAPAKHIVEIRHSMLAMLLWIEASSLLVATSSAWMIHHSFIVWAKSTYTHNHS